MASRRRVAGTWTASVRPRRFLGLFQPLFAHYTPLRRSKLATKEGSSTLGHNRISLRLLSTAATSAESRDICVLHVPMKLDLDTAGRRSDV
ncbi:hypothetical protein BDV98DRAFT_563007 [Pterulicium gracile]|uniref:Uncharacterized protein n=1 Tax=Pterulicium gracile TaxID=1884261 RepID=A0A5C3QSE2_9AGAR|nr:hypothetical protein BDV98DRAFT_563007 [Pterula gracilis]